MKFLLQDFVSNRFHFFWRIIIPLISFWWCPLYFRFLTIINLVFKQDLGWAKVASISIQYIYVLDATFGGYFCQFVSSVLKRWIVLQSVFYLDFSCACQVPCYYVYISLSLTCAGLLLLRGQWSLHGATCFQFLFPGLWID